jgi:heme/copper-type cytochrome/quinol oxidase subunit 4
MKNQKSKKLEKMRFFPSGNNWKKVLLEIYNNSPHSYGESHKVNFNDDNHPLAKKLKLTGYELMLAISFLRGNKLIEDSHSKEPLDHPTINPGWSSSIFLTEKGFNFSVKLENELSNQKTQVVIMIFAVITGITGFMGFFFDKVENKESKFLIALIYGVIVLIILFAFKFENISTNFRRWKFNRYIKNGGSITI